MTMKISWLIIAGVVSGLSSGLQTVVTVGDGNQYLVVLDSDTSDFWVPGPAGYLNTTRDYYQTVWNGTTVVGTTVVDTVEVSGWKFANVTVGAANVPSKQGVLGLVNVCEKFGIDSVGLTVDGYTPNIEIDASSDGLLDSSPGIELNRVSVGNRLAEIWGYGNFSTSLDALQIPQTYLDLLDLNSTNPCNSSGEITLELAAGKIKLPTHSLADSHCSWKIVPGDSIVFGIPILNKLNIVLTENATWVGVRATPNATTPIGSISFTTPSEPTSIDYSLPPIPSFPSLGELLFLFAAAATSSWPSNPSVTTISSGSPPSEAAITGAPSWLVPPSSVNLATTVNPVLLADLGDQAADILIDESPPNESDVLTAAYTLMAVQTFSTSAHSSHSSSEAATTQPVVVPLSGVGVRLVNSGGWLGGILMMLFL